MKSIHSTTRTYPIDMDLSDQITATTNYDRFSFIGNNREVNRGHIEKLKEAFQTVGNLTKVQPILVNDKFQIIDGQHRFIAARDLGESVYYTVVAGLGITEARQMNILHKGWRTDDYAHSYAEGGDINYKRYLELKENYPYSHSVLLTACGVRSDTEGKGSFTRFRNGEFVLTEEGFKRAQARLDTLEETAELVPQYRQKEFSYAYLTCLDNENFDHTRMLKKLAEAPELPKYGSKTDYLRALEEVYNFRVQNLDKRVRLF